MQDAKGRFAILLCLITCLSGTAQTVEKVRATFDQSKQLMSIYYDLKGLNYRKEINIIPYLLPDDTSTIKSLSGDVGWVARGGKNKLVVWDAFKDGVNSLNDVQIGIKTEIRNVAAARYRNILLHGSNSAPMGLKFVQLNRVGFFAGFRRGLVPPAYRYTVSNAGEMNYLESGVYEIGSERSLAAYAITAGPVFQLSRNLYSYAGAGYGVEQLFWQYRAYNLDKTLIGSYWALNENINRKGITADAGLVIRVGWVCIDLGMSTIELKSFQIIGGLGFSF